MSLSPRTRSLPITPDFVVLERFIAIQAALSKDCSDPKKLDRKVAIAIKLMPQGFELGRGQIVQG